MLHKVFQKGMNEKLSFSNAAKICFHREARQLMSAPNQNKFEVDLNELKPISIDLVLPQFVLSFD